MDVQFRNIGIIGRVGTERILSSVRVLTDFLIARDLTVVFEKELAERLPDYQLQVSSRNLIGEMCDLVVVVGGDGSMLGVLTTEDTTLFSYTVIVWLLPTPTISLLA